MSDTERGVSALSLRPGAYAIEPAEWRRDAGQQLSNLTSGSGEDGEPLWHLHDVQRADGTTVLEVCEDRRSMEGTLQTEGRKFLFRSPDGEPLMAYERDGFAVGTTCTLEDRTSGDRLGSWEASGLLGRLFRGRWELSDPGGAQRAKAIRKWSLGALVHPTFDLETMDGADIGRLAMERNGMFYAMDATVDESAIPVEVALAMAYGILWAFSQG